MARAGTVGVGFASDMPTRIMKSEILDPMSVFSLRNTTDTRARRTNRDATNHQPPHPSPERRALIWMTSPFPELPAPDVVGSWRWRRGCFPALAEVAELGDASCPAGSLCAAGDSSPEDDGDVFSRGNEGLVSTSPLWKGRWIVSLGAVSSYMDSVAGPGPWRKSLRLALRPGLPRLTRG